ncbi:Siroheme synthase [Candidatus Methanoperedenaceae archaeon GB50]|nr:Siroheme synthase [Candidatus Methanoperedenaceae archaeon GB50]
MRYYPVCLRPSRGKNCLVVGGGKVALRKIKRLLDGGANIKVSRPKEVIPELKSIISDKKITYLGAEYKTDYLKDVFLVIGATNDEILNARLSKEANAANILCNIVDQPEKCNFYCAFSSN